MRIRSLLVTGLVMILVASLLLADCGASSSHTATGSAVSAVTIPEVMTDNDFDRAGVEVKAGQTVRFEFRNAGHVVHEAFVGDEAAQQSHEHEMMSGSMAGHDMGDANTVVVSPGATATLTHTFSKKGTFFVGCHEPGHYAAGMRILVTVT
jgi:uncharacterized cupredoxin-like copper-binding protein